MSRQAKLIERLKSKPKDLTWGELETLLTGFGYELEKGAGSRRKFYHEETGAMISIHEPHPRKILKAYQVKDVLDHLRERGAL